MRTIDMVAISGGGSGTREIAADTAAVPSSARMNCDRIAPFYQAAEYLSFGGMVHACRVMFLGAVSDCRRALVCGDGDGRFLAELLRRNREVRADFVDLSAGMIDLAGRRVEAIGRDAVARTRFHVADLREFEFSDRAAYDLITAHFFLDCFDDAGVNNVAQRLSSVARPGATLLVSDFRIPPRGVARYISAAIIRGLYAGFRAVTGLRVTRLPNYESALVSAGFEKQREALKLGGLLTASLWRRS